MQSPRASREGASRYAEEEGDALLMDDLNGNKEVHARANGHSKIPLLPAVANLLKRASTRLSRSLTTAVPTRAPRSSSNIIRTIFNYPEPNLELRQTAWLDGLRGVAAFEVFVFHYIDRWMEKSVAYGEGRYRDGAWYRLPFFRTFYASGDTAVTVFFAISGYVLTHRMLSLIRQKRLEELYASLSSAVFRRGIRLYMPVVIDTFTLMFLGRYFGLPKPSHWTPEPTFLLELKRWFVQFVHLLIPLRYPDRFNEILNMYDGTISWTIPLEYYGSLIVYVAILLFSRTSSMTVRLSIIAGLVVSSVLKDDWIAAQFLLGMAFADYQLEVASNPSLNSPTAKTVRKVLFWGAFVFGFYLAGIPGGHYVDEHQKFRLWSRPYYDWISQPLAAIGMYADRQVDRYIECLAGISLVIGVGETQRLKQLMETRFVQYLGKISFGLYFCHIFVHEWIKPLDPFWFSFMGLDPALLPHERDASLNLFLSYILMMIPAMVINFIMAGLFERYVDKPSVRTARAFEVYCLSQGKTAAEPEDGLQRSTIPPPPS